MNRKSSPENLPPDFSVKYAEYSDSEIIGILKKRNHYQNEAEKAAINEALKRGLIHSEQDLFKEEFREEKQGFSFFPYIENEKARTKTRKSIARSLLIVGAIPTVWGVYKIYLTQMFEGGILLSLGLLWMSISFQMMKAAGTKMFNLLFLMWLAAVGYFLKLIFTASSVKVVDVFFITAICLLVFYGLLYYRKIS